MALLFHSWLHTLLREAPTPTLGWSVQRATHEARNRNDSSHQLGRLAGLVATLGIENSSQSPGLLPRCLCVYRGINCLQKSCPCGLCVAYDGLLFVAPELL